MSKILPTGEVLFSIYDDILTRSLDSVRIGRECGKKLEAFNNVFIGKRAGYLAKYSSDCVYIGFNAGKNIANGNSNIIIGYDSIEKDINNVISIGNNNYTDDSSISIGYNNQNIGLNNISLGYNNINNGINIYSFGNNNNVQNIDVQYNNLLNNFLDMKTIYTNIYNSKNNILKKETLFTLPLNDLSILRQNSYIINGISYINYNNTNLNINNDTTSNINLPNNSIYNLFNICENNIVNIPISTINRVAKPFLNNNNQIEFNINDGITPTSYSLFYYVSTLPEYGNFAINIVDNLSNLNYVSNRSYDNQYDSYGITPYIKINNEYIKGTEKKFYNLERKFNNLNTQIINNQLPNFSKEIIIKSNNVNLNLFGFDYIKLKEYLLNFIDYSNDDNIFFTIVEFPKCGFICNLNDTKTILSTFHISNLNYLIYQNYFNKNDKCTLCCSYGFNLASKTLLTINFNIINTYKITYQDIYTFNNVFNKNNIISYDGKYAYINNNNNLLNLKDYINTTNKIRTFISNNNDIQYLNNLLQYFNNISSEINYNIYNNNYISSNLLTNYYNINFQSIKYDINFLDKITINLDVKPNVIFENLTNATKYEFYINFYNNNNILDRYLYNSGLLLNKYNNIEIEYTNILANNVRLEYYISSNILNTFELINYTTDLYFKDFIIKKNNIDINNYNIALGNSISSIGKNNIAIGSNFYIIGNNSIVVGNNNSDNKIYESIIIGNNNFNNSFANNAIILGNNNTSIYQQSPIIIGNNIIDNKYSLNIDNTICKLNNVLYLGIDNLPIAIGYNKDELLPSTNSIINIKGTISIDNINLTNSNNYTINLKANENLDRNIIYTLPNLPASIKKVMLTTDVNGNMLWNEIDTFETDFINIDNIITNKLIATGEIRGDGNKITNLSLRDKTTDELVEGVNNLYFTSLRVENAFSNKIKDITTDDLKEGVDNLFYTKKRADDTFYEKITLITSDNINSGTNNLYFNKKYLELAIYENIKTSNTTDIFTEGSNLFYTYPRFRELFSNNIADLNTDNVKQGHSNLYFNENIIANNFNIILNNLSSDKIKEGSSNLYFTSNRVKTYFNEILQSKTTDDIPEGLNNLYYKTINATKMVNKILTTKTTDDIIEGKINLYYTFNRFQNYLNNITSDNIITGTSNLFFNKTIFLNELNKISLDNIKSGTSNLYYNENIASNIFFSNINNITLDNIKNGSINKYIVNNTIDDNLNIKGNLYASNIIINGSNLLDIYNQSISNLSSNYAKTVNRFYKNSNVNINNTSNVNLIFRIYNDNKIKINKRGPPIIVVGSNVGMNNLIPKYNLDVYGITNSTYFKGDGSLLNNLNLNDKTTDDIQEGNNNLYLTKDNLINLLGDNNIDFTNHTASNLKIYEDLQVDGTLYVSNLFIYGIGSNFENLGKNNNIITCNIINDITNQTNFNTYGVSNINIGTSNSIVNINVDFKNKQGLTINNTGPPFIIIDNKVGMNTLIPRFNLDVNGYAFAENFIGDGTYLCNVNLNDRNSDMLNQGIHNKYIIDNLYENNLTIYGNIMAEQALFDGNIKPVMNDEYDIGGFTTRWNNIFVNNINLGNSLKIIPNNNDLSFLNNNTNTGILVDNIKIKDKKIYINDAGYIKFNQNNTDVKCILYNDLVNIPTTLVESNVLCNLMINYDFINSNILNNIFSNLNVSNIPLLSHLINYKDNLINFSINKNSLYINSSNELSIIKNRKNNSITNFSLKQGFENNENLWYHQININDFYNKVYIDQIDYNLINITSWYIENNDLNYVYNSLYWNASNTVKIVNNTNNNTYKNITYNGSIIKEGWYASNEYLTWISDSGKTVNNIFNNILEYNKVDIFQFNLHKNYINNPNLWYHQIKIGDYYKEVIHNNNNNFFKVFKIYSWTNNNLNPVYKSLVLINNTTKIVESLSQDSELINYNINTNIKEGWANDTNIEYMSWFSANFKIVYNIITPIISKNVFKIDLKQGYNNNQNLWYHQFEIDKYNFENIYDNLTIYKVFEIISWSENLDIINNIIVWIYNSGNIYIKKVGKSSSQNKPIIYDSETNVNEGWQTDTNGLYLTWLSDTNKTIYNYIENVSNKEETIVYNDNITSNIFKTYLKNSQTTDDITEGPSNKFITNNTYNNNLNIIGSLSTTKQLEINNNTTNTAFIVKQYQDNKDIANFYINTYPILSITKNSNIGIGIDEPNILNKLEIKGNINVIGDILQNSININNNYFSSNDITNVLQSYTSSNSINHILTYQPINFIGKGIVSNHYISKLDFQSVNFTLNDKTAIIDVNKLPNILRPGDTIFINNTYYKLVYNSTSTSFTIGNANYNDNDDFPINSTNYIFQHFRLLFESANNITCINSSHISNIMGWTIVLIPIDKTYSFNVLLHFDMKYATDFVKFYVRLTRNSIDYYLRNIIIPPITPSNNNTSFTISSTFRLFLLKDDIITFESNYNLISSMDSYLEIF